MTEEAWAEKQQALEAEDEKAAAEWRATRERLACLVVVGISVGGDVEPCSYGCDLDTQLDPATLTDLDLARIREACASGLGDWREAFEAKTAGFVTATCQAFPFLDPADDILLAEPLAAAIRIRVGQDLIRARNEAQKANNEEGGAVPAARRKR